MASVLRSASCEYPLVTIHREKKDPDVCPIGRVLSVNGKGVVLREVTPGGTWDVEDSAYKVPEITRVDFAGGGMKKHLRAWQANKEMRGWLSREILRSRGYPSVSAFRYWLWERYIDST